MFQIRAWFLVIAAFSGLLDAKSATQRIGDVLAVAIPLTALGATLYKQDKAGQYQLLQSYSAAMASTMVLIT